MAIASKKTESAYAGFLNGYIAGNLSANTPELHLHADRIFKFLVELKADVFKWDLSDEQKEKFNSYFSSKTISPISSYTETKHYLSLGETIYELLDYIISVKQNLPSSTAFILKKIVYHYLNIAKTANHTTVINQAKKIAEKFELSAS